MIKLKLGAKGELVIPKKIREQLGLVKEKAVILSVKDKTIEIKSQPKDIIEKWEKRAKKYKEDVTKWVYGDKLYEEVF